MPFYGISSTVERDAGVRLLVKLCVCVHLIAKALSGCGMLFSQDTDACREFADSLAAAERNPDSRGTVDCGADMLSWGCNGVTVNVRQKIDRADTAALVWHEAIVIATYVQAHLSNLGHVCDLGAGTGILGIWLAKAGHASTVVLADRAPWLPYLNHNIALNTPPLREGAVVAKSIKWGVRSQLSKRFDTVIASSLLYDSTQHEDLMTTLVHLNPLQRILLAYAIRDSQSEELFMSKLGEHYDCTLVQSSDVPGYVVLLWLMNPKLETQTKEPC